MPNASMHADGYGRTSFGTGFEQMISLFEKTRQNYALPASLEFAIRQYLDKHNITSKQIANAVLRMSDFYIEQPQAHTPWHEDWCQIAQVAYFLPLNFMRAQAVWDQCQEQIEKQNFSLSTKGFVDYGSGLGAGTLPALLSAGKSILTTHLDSDLKLNSKFDVTFIERSKIAHDLFSQLYKSITDHLASANPQNTSAIHAKKIEPKQISIGERDNLGSQTVGKTILCSYSLTEHGKLPPWLKDAHSLILIEPATREDGRQLLKLRQQLLTDGFYISAPCTHQLACPLLANSENDWCHDRIHINMPDWFLEAEKHLPIKNENLTFSYLIAQKNKPTKNPVVNDSGSLNHLEFNLRVIGDTLVEKGKSRQLICQGSERQFLSWMHRNFDKHNIIPRGIQLNHQDFTKLEFEQKGQEIRIKLKPTNT